MEEKRSFVRLEDRLSFIDSALREAPRPLTAHEICQALGWEPQSDGNAVRRALKKYPDRYKPTKGQKRNECYLFVDPLVKTLGETVGERQPTEASTTREVLPVDVTARLEAECARLRRLLVEIRTIVEEAAKSGNTHRAFFSFGRISSLLEDVRAEEGAQEAAPP